jgi:hypothetical protein
MHSVDATQEAGPNFSCEESIDASRRPVLAGLLADIEGKYEMTFILFGVLSLVASVPLFLAGPP